MNHNFLEKHQTVVEVVRVYEQARADIEAGFALLEKAEKELNDTFSMDHWRTLRIRNRYSGYGMNWTKPDDAIEMLKRDVWSCLVDRLELRRFMSNKRWKELEQAIEKGEVPEITVENVMAFGEATLEKLPDMVKEAVQEVYEFLRPRRSDYKTNTELELGEKVILEYRVEKKICAPGFRVNYHYQQELTCLENVFQVLDGRGPINKHHRSELQDSIDQSSEGRGETTYFEWKAYKKGTLHLKFKRMDLVKRFNEVAGGKRLRPKTEVA